MWRSDLIVTVSDDDAIYMHLEGRGYYDYVHLWFFLIRLASVGAPRSLRVKGVLFSGCIAWPDMGARPAFLPIQKRAESVLFLWMSDVEWLTE